MAAITITTVVYPETRQEWRDWLHSNFDQATEVWVAMPKKDKPVEYNDIIEEALCFNWIDSTQKTLDANHTVLRMSPRRAKAGFSQLNIERIKLMLAAGKVHPRFTEALSTVADAPFLFPEDILAAIRSDKTAWDHYRAFPEGYKRLRIASIEAARNTPDLFGKRLETFIQHCLQRKLVPSVAGMDKYF